jgi:hypothetical protein
MSVNLSERDLLLINNAIDGTLSPGEAQEFERLLADRPDVRHEYESLKSVKEVTMELKFKQPPGETWDRYWAGVYSRLERGIAWLLISIGAAVVLAIAGYGAVMKLLEDTATPLAVKLGVGALLLGGAILLVSVLREKLFMRKTDKYQEVIR